MEHALIRMRAKVLLPLLLCTLLFTTSINLARGQSDDDLPDVEDLDSVGSLSSVDDILNMDLDQLAHAPATVESMDTVVTTVNRQASTVGRTPAAIFVITQEMIHRSAANNVPDLLRMVPGIQVARIDANKWMITCRGFSGRLANKLLVQIDGRSVYTQGFGGVYWHMQDLMLQDIERIEVVRGPGGTVWGANAVNGVINIITKQASDTQGLLAFGGSGTEDRVFGSVRYGGQVGEELQWRAYGKFLERDGGFSPVNDFDDWRQYRAGFRSDWQPGDSDTVTVQGDFSEGQTGWSTLFGFPPYSNQPFEDVPSRTRNVLARWVHTIDDESDVQLYAYYDFWSLPDSAARHMQEQTVNVDFQHHFRLGERHNVIYGAAYRNIRSDIILDSPIVGTITPPKLATDLYSCFIQDEIMLEEDRWYLTMGSKFEHNDFSGFEYQPSIRLLHLPSERASTWCSVSRAVRTPARIDQDVTVNIIQSPIGPVFARLTGFPTVQAEDLLATEWGYRAQPADDFSWDLACFYSRYEDLVEQTPGAPFFDPVLGATIVPLNTGNSASADTYGAELTSTVDLTPQWKMMGSYTFLQLNINAPPGDFREGASPHNQLYVRSAWTPGNNWDYDVYLRYVDNLSSLNIPRYATMDIRMAWHPRQNLEWALVGRNLLDARHAETTDTFAGVFGTEVERELFSTLTRTY